MSSKCNWIWYVMTTANSTEELHHNTRRWYCFAVVVLARFTARAICLCIVLIFVLCLYICVNLNWVCVHCVSWHYFCHWYGRSLLSLCIGIHIVWSIALINCPSRFGNANYMVCEWSIVQLEQKCCEFLISSDQKFRVFKESLEKTSIWKNLCFHVHFISKAKNSIKGIVSANIFF